LKIEKMRHILLVGMMVLCLLLALTPFAMISAADVPVITTINPSSGAPGATLNGVVIIGTDLTGTTAVTFSGNGVTASNIVEISDTQITATVTITGAALPGMRNVTVTSAKGTSASLAEGFSVSSAGAATISLDAPANVAAGSGFYATINITGATNLNGYSVRIYFNPAVIQMAGLDLLIGSGSGISDGVVNGVTIPKFGWSYQPNPGTPSGEIKMIGHLPGISTASGSGYLAKIHFMVLGAAGSQTSLSLGGIDLVDAVGHETFPVSPTPLTVAVSSNPALVTSVNTLAATSITTTAATLNGQLTGLGAASSVNLFLGYGTEQGGPYTLVSGPTVNSAPAPALPVSYSSNITALMPGTTYFYIAQAQYNGQIVSGAEMTFNTAGVVPALTSLNPNSGTPGTTLNGVVISR